MKVKLILPALTEAKSPFWRPIKYSLFPPLWDVVIRARRVADCRPLLETILAGFGRHIARRPDPTRSPVAEPSARPLK